MLDFNLSRCPRCGGTNTHWRSGVHFEYRCADCSLLWKPMEEHEKWQRQERERLAANTLRE